MFKVTAFKLARLLITCLFPTDNSWLEKYVFVVDAYVYCA